MMATVEMRFSALPAHVRTARLVAAAHARRAGLEAGVLDEVRLAVGEACSRAVELHRSAGVSAPVTVVLAEDRDRFTVAVGDSVPVAEAKPTGGGAAADADPEDVLTGDLGLAVITGLVEQIDVDSGPQGSVIRMSWPTLA